MQKQDKIYIAGHRGMVGSAIWRQLKAEGYTNLIGRTRKELDLIDQQAVADFFAKEKPKYVFLAAAKVGGIVANNTYRAQFIYENLQIQNNIIHQAYVHGVKKLMFLGSSCIYPKMAPQPMNEEVLLTGKLEPTNEPYALAKIAGIKMCDAYRDQYGCNFISVMPTNLYGPNDNFDLEKSHVLPAIIRKMHLGKWLEKNDLDTIRADFAINPIEGVNHNVSEQEILDQLAKYGITVSPSPPSSTKRHRQVTITLWGTGTPKREFLYVDDMAAACIHLMHNFNEKGFVNIGCGEDLSIKDLSTLIKEEIGYTGKVVFDTTKPDGTPQKLLNIDKLKEGFEPQIGLREGIGKVYKSVCQQVYKSDLTTL